MIELLMAMSVMVIIGGVVAVLASAVQTGNQYSLGMANATQHGRVALERIAHMVRTATASEDFPGCAVVEVTLDSAQVADTLVVWHPSEAPANPAGPPLARELVIYGPDPSDGRKLVEITPSSSDGRAMPSPATNYTGWVTFIAELVTSSLSTKTVLTDLLRAASVAYTTGPLGSGPGTVLRGAVQFECRVAPSADDWSAYRAGKIAWNDLPWPQGLYGSRMGVRQIAVAMELQLTSQPTASGQVSAAGVVVPMFGSATANFELSK
jgi:Tfp pilus assembly protein PilW